MRSICSVAVLCFSAFMAFLSAQEPRGPKYVLLLHQAGSPAPFRGKFDVAFASAIRPIGSTPFDLYEESIDTQRFPGDEQSRITREYLKNKYANRRIDVIVTQGMHSLNFARGNRELFGNPPIVAAASPPGEIEGSNDNVTGLQGGFFINRTVDLALTLRPDTTSVVVVDGARENLGEFQPNFERQFQKRRPRVALVYLRDLPLRDVVARVAASPEHSIVFFVRQTMLNRVQDVDPFEALAQVVSASTVPVFSQTEEYLGHGILGGNIWRFEIDARRMAEMAMRIANGASVRDVPPERSTYASMIDWRQLQRWKIPESRLPAGSVVLFRQSSFFEAYRGYVGGGVLVFFAQLALILGLLVQNRRRRHAEEQKRKSDDRYRSVVDTQSELICRFLPDSTLTFVNDAYCRFWEKTPEELLGTKFTDLIPASGRPAVLERIGRIQNSYDSHEHQVMLRDGTIGWHQWMNHAVVHESGAVVELQGVGRDITDRKRAEEALSRLEARNGAILRAIPDLMFVMLRDGTYVDYHARDPKLLFVPPEMFIGKKVSDVLPPALAETFMRAIEQACASSDPVVVEYELRLEEPRHFEARLVNAERGRVLSMVRDVTDAKNSQARNRDLAGRLIVSQEMERQRIARELHDDLSQKIALLNIEIDQMAAVAPGHDSRTRLRDLSVRAGEIATDVHNLSHELHPSKLETLGLMAAVQALCQEVARQTGVDIAFTAGTLPGPIDPGVSLCLYRVTQEALHNVATHSRARTAAVRLGRDDDVLSLQIADSGVGFDPHVQHAGLGLVSMRERVALAKGQLIIHASDGRGTHIGVRVPMSAAAADQSSAVSQSARQRRLEEAV